jgi:hypothetical protein
MVKYTTIVNTSIEKVWCQLLLKIEHPENFVPGVSNVIISEKNADFVFRQMTITSNENRSVLNEKITFTPYKVRYILWEHPSLEGYVDNEIRFISNNQTEMTFTMNWKNKETQLEVNTIELVKLAVEKTKSYIEETL